MDVFVNVVSRSCSCQGRQHYCPPQQGTKETLTESYITSPHDSRLARVESQLDLAFQHDAVVDGYRPVHGRRAAWPDIDDA